MCVALKAGRQHVTRQGVQHTTRVAVSLPVCGCSRRCSCCISTKNAVASRTLMLRSLPVLHASCSAPSGTT